MAYPLFSPPYPPMAPVEDSLQARRINAKFGDGYLQSTLDGVNAEQSNVQLIFEPLSPAQFLVLDAFLDENAGFPILYALPTDIAPRAWVSSDWAWTRRASYYSLQVTLVETLQIGGFSLNFSKAPNSLYLGIF